MRSVAQADGYQTGSQVQHAYHASGATVNFNSFKCKCMLQDHSAESCLPVFRQATTSRSLDPLKKQESQNLRELRCQAKETITQQCMCFCLVGWTRSDQQYGVRGTPRSSSEANSRASPSLHQRGSETTARVSIVVSLNVGTRSHLQASIPFNGDHDKLTILTSVH